MKTIAGYAITEELYQGRNSLVYRGYRKTDRQPVILKLLNLTQPTPEQIARFMVEYETIRRLNNGTRSGQAASGVVHAYELSTEQQQWIMVLEDIGGEALDRLLARRPFTVAEFLALALQLVDSLDQVHQRQVIHKDLTSSNIILNPMTGQLNLIDFDIATTLTRENLILRNANVLEGTLAYMSPEQTGRMNRGLDYRTDFYSLGVIFYQTLSGQLPFTTTDALELVHCHLAKSPTPLHELNSAIPQPLAEIVLTLLAKNAEQRYQSVLSLKADLTECLRQWQSNKQIDPFLLRQHDVPSQLQISQVLYGRATEIEQLLAAFERVSHGAREVMMVAGYTGIGKSALVQEIYKPITHRRGYFITGKFDQLQRDIPYASLLQAFRGLVRQLLTETEQAIATWRAKLLRALGPNGRVIVDVIPEIELIIGPQPPVPDLPPTEAQNRFHLVFHSFLNVFTQPEHPLVIFLDDLQWADGASLKLLSLLLTARASKYLFFIGAYRENEVGETHPLRLTLDEIQKADATVNQILLAPLALVHIVQLLVDTLHCSSSQAEPLAKLVITKTAGNPFFVTELIKSLDAEALFVFDAQQGQWQWDLAQIQAHAIADNVAELMSTKVQKLSATTRQVLQLAACIGNHFDLHMLSIVNEHTLPDTAAALWEALTEGLILPLGDAYKLINLDVQGLAEAVKVEYRFAHDQIQQAAYALIPATEKQVVHQRIGRLLLQNTTLQERDQKIFDIANQLNLGRVLLTAQTERDEVAQLNLAAGKKAKASAAFQPALHYLQVGLELLSPPAGREQPAIASWERQYDLTLTLHVEAAEAAYLNTNFAQMQQMIAMVLEQAKTLLDKVPVYSIQIQADLAQNQPLEAVRTGLSVLALLGVRFPEKPRQVHIIVGLAETKLKLAGKLIEDLGHLPAMRDPIKLAAMRIMNAISAPAYLAMPTLFPLIVFTEINLSLKYGNTAESGLAYASYAIILAGVLGDIPAGARFAQTALHVLERFNARQLKSKIFFVVYFFIKPWIEHTQETVQPLLEAYQSALDTGDFESAANVTNALNQALFYTTKNLAEANQAMTAYCEITATLKQARALYANELYRQTTLNLLKVSENPCSLVGERYDEHKMLSLYQATNDLNAIAHLSSYKLMLCYLFQDYAQALENAERLEKHLDAVLGLYTIAYFYFYDSLTRLALFATASRLEQKRLLRKVVANQKKMKKWATHAPVNYSHKFYLVEAERARVLGNEGEARTYYDKAIGLAIENGYVNEEALGYELAGRFYLARGQTRIAQLMLGDAHYAYQRWGAEAKSKDLEQRYPQWLRQSASPSLRTGLAITTTNSGNISAALELTSVLKASQAISGEIQLGKLLDKLMKVVIENAGAQRGFLLLERKGQWLIEAEGVIETAEATDSAPAVTALQAIPVAESGQLSTAIINYVARTRENVVLDNATQTGLFTQDPYILRTQPKSVLCAPLINQGKLTAILYLENNLTTNAFTPDRLEVLNLLSAQAAISIENARLYSHQVALTNGYSRFVPKDILRFLQKESIVDVKLGDQVQQEMAILVSDIRDFTPLSETMSPQENFDFVNAYLSRISPIIRQHNGLIVKYMGDGMMAVFPARAEDALAASLQKLRHLAHYNQERLAHNRVPLRIGIGIHTGTMMLGTVGEPERMQSDLLSDTVNLTARLEGLAKEYGASLIISHEFLQRLPDPTAYKVRFLGKSKVKGRQALVTVYEIFDTDPPEQIECKLQTKRDFEAGIALFYDDCFVEAAALFERVVTYNPQDKAADLYLQRARLHLQPLASIDPAGVALLTGGVGR